MTIYLDFDGTVVEHHYPAIGAENPHALRIIRALQHQGHRILLNTYRADLNDGSLEESLAYLNHPERNLLPITEYTPLKIHPGPFDLNEAMRFNKVFLDDIAESIPLIPNRVLDHGLMVDWVSVELELQKFGLL